MSAKQNLKDVTQAALQAQNAGERRRAFELSCMAMADAGASHLQRLVFVETSSGVALAGFDPMVKNALTLALTGDGIDHQKLISLWADTVQCDPALSILNDDYTLQNWERVCAAASDPSFLAGLAVLIITRPAIEQNLIRLRKFLLLEAYLQKILKTKDINFLSALAQQCFFNEYIYPLTAAENDALKNMPLDDPLSVCLIGCYAPLFKHAIKPKLSAVVGYRQLIKIQMDAPLMEQSLEKTIPVIGQSTDDVSKNVQAMYEENPYPRWNSLHLSHKSYDDIKGTMLVAGCGTGRSTLQIAHALPNMNITAIDMTRASIAYAMRNAQEQNVRNIRFAQCDILALDALSDQFDFVECSGVLHHMKDPLAGWRALTHRLEDGGLMLIALYSVNARKIITQIQNHVKEKNYPANLDGIRALRAEIMAMPHDHPFRAILQNRDFYAASDIRDLLFHVQEVNYTLLQIHEMLESLGLEFVGFKTLHPLLRQKYPDVKDLPTWHEIEAENPKQFFGMYEFLCKRKGEELNETAQKILYNALNLK